MFSIGIIFCTCHKSFVQFFAVSDALPDQEIVIVVDFALDS